MRGAGRVLLSLPALGLVACGGGGGAAGQAAPGAWFREGAKAAGVDVLHGFGPTRYWIPEIAAGGLTLFDMEGDGDLDLYVVQGADLRAQGGGSTGTNLLFENQGGGRFVDITERAGVGDTGFGYSCAVGDVDRDGLLDLYVTNVGDNVLYRNLGDGRFQDVTTAANAAGSGWSSTASFLDHDGDGDLDLYVVNYIDWSPEAERECLDARGGRSYCSPVSFQSPARDTLLVNRGDGTFEDRSVAAGLDAARGTGLGIVWGRLDDTPGLDVFVANDGMANQLWSGRAGGGFKDRALLCGCALSANGVAEAGMGVCLEDLDRDGHWDLVLTHLEGETNTFYMGSGSTFRDRSTRSGTSSASLQRTGFGIGFVDFDHDGWQDLYVANGRILGPAEPEDPTRPFAEPDQLFRGLPGGRFEELPHETIVGARTLTVGRTAAFGDLDDDGDVDVCVSECGGPLRLLFNEAPKVGGALTLTVLGRDGLAAVGAVVRYELSGTRVMRQVQRSWSYAASNDPRLHVGLGEASGLESVEVTWLDGTTSTFGPFAAGERPVLRRD